MADVHLQTFDKRLRRISRRHRKMVGGYVTSVNHDGLIIARPRRHAPRFPWKGLMLTVVLLLLFKGFLFISLGSITYDARGEKLRAGTIIEQAGAFAMQADPATIWIADQIKFLVN
ncbi:MAG: hypothetical protein ACC631_05975 [Halocynthiibacter sp.]